MQFEILILRFGVASSLVDPEKECVAADAVAYVAIEREVRGVDDGEEDIVAT